MAIGDVTGGTTSTAFQSAQGFNPKSNVRMKMDAFGGRHFSVGSSLSTTDLDPSEYAEAVAGIKRAEATEYRDKVSNNLKVIAQLKELKAKITSAQTSAQALSNYLGADTNRANLWQDKVPSLVDTVTGGSVSNLVKVTATKQAAVRDFTLRVTQVAKADVKISTLSTATPATALGLTGNLNIGGTVVAVTALQSLNDVMNAVNQVTATTNIKMEIIPTDGTNYTFQLVSTVLGTPINISASDGLLATSLGLNKDAITLASTLNLQMTYNSQVITRASTNIVSDLIPGVTIEVYGTTPNVVQGKIDYDRTKVANGFVGFVNDYNDLRKFANEQTAYEADKVTPKDGAVLHRSSGLRRVLSDAGSTLTSWVEGLATLTNLGDIGLSVGKSSFDASTQAMTAFSNDITIDAAKLDQLINSDKLTQVMAVVGNQATSTNGYFKVYGIPNFQLNDTYAGVPVTVSIQKAGGVVSATFSDGTTTTAATLLGTNLIAGTGGGIIQGAAGTPFEGFSVGIDASVVTGLVNNGAAVATTVTATQGVLASLEKTLGAHLVDKVGTIDAEIAQLEAQNTTNTEQAERLEDRAKREYDRVLNEFNRIRELEAQFKQFTEAMDQIMALMTARH